MISHPEVIEGDISVGLRKIIAEWSLKHEDLIILQHSRPARDQEKLVIIADVISVDDYNQYILKK